MKQLFFYLTGIALLTGGATEKSLVFEDVEPVTECTGCEKAYKECTRKAQDIYTTAVEKASDSVSRKSSRLDYNAACEKARNVKNKAISECTETYNKCCLAETKAKLEKKKEGQQ